MKKIIGYIQKYLLFAAPVVLATTIWGTIQSDLEIRRTDSAIAKTLWEVMSWSLMIWFLLLVVFMFLLAFRKETQNETIKFIAGLKDRDEREELITGLAAKRAFTATSCILIFLLFLSCFTLTIAKLPQSEVVDGRKSSLSIGFSLVGTDVKTTTSQDGNITYEHHDLPLSKSVIILLVLFWQLASFRLQARRELSGIS